MEDKSIRLDWDGVERDYKAGLLSVGMVAAKWGISLVTLQRIAHAKTWKREEVHPPNPPPLGGGVPPGSSISSADAAGTQARQILAIVNEHRRDILKVRGLSNLLLERLWLILTGVTVDMPCLGGRESPGDLLKKLAAVTGLTIQLEREVLGLSSHLTPLGGEESGESAEWNAVKKMLEAIHSERVIDVHEINEVKKK